MRVELRHLAGEDRDDFVAAMARSRSFHSPWIAPPTTAEEFDALLRRTDYESFATFLLRLVDDGRIAGFFSISEIVRRGFQSAFLGYAGVAGLEGRGYMTEGLWLLLEHAFTEMGLHRLEANIQPGNTASIELVRRCGFVREGFSEKYLRIEGEWRDHERWATRVDLWGRARGVAVVLREVTRKAADAILAGERPEGVRVADDYPTEFSTGMAQAVGTEGQFHYLVHGLEDDIVVGEIGAAFVDEEGTIEIGYAIVESQQNRGYATAAVEALVAKLRDVTEVRRFVAHAPLDRPGSGRVVEKAGFAMVRETDDTDEAGNVLRVREWELAVST